MPRRAPNRTTRKSASTLAPVPDDPINPAHYKARVKLRSGPTVDLEVADVIRAYFKQDGLLSQAMKYLGRAGRKPDSSYIKCLKKCRWWIDQAIEDAENGIV